MPTMRDDGTAKVTSNPLALINGLFNQANQPVQDEHDWGVEAYFRRLLQDPSTREQVTLKLLLLFHSVMHRLSCELCPFWSLDAV